MSSLKIDDEVPRKEILDYKKKLIDEYEETIADIIGLIQANGLMTYRKMQRIKKNAVFKLFNNIRQEGHQDGKI